MEVPILRLLIALLALLTAIPLAAQAEDDVPAAPSPFVYAVDPINRGVPAVDPPVLLDTPQAALESFLDAAADEDWLRAAQVLDFENIPEGERASKAEEYARQMHELVNRSIAIDWASLPDRPDAMNTTGSDKDPFVAKERRSITLARLEAGNRIVPLRLARLSPPEGDPVWMFSRQSVENLPTLYGEYGPTKLEKRMPAAMREKAFWTLAWWEVIALPLVLLIAIALAALVYNVLRKLRRRSDDSSLVKRMAATMAMPAALFTLAGVFIVVRKIVFNFSATVANFIDPLQVTFIVVAIASLLVAAIDAIIEFVTDKKGDNLEDPHNEPARDFFTQVSAVRRLFIVMVVLFAIGIVLIQSNLAATLGFSMIASAGVIGLTLAFGARKVLADLMASIQIAFAKTARIGDSVHYDGRWNFVEHIGFTHVQLRTWDGKRIMAPVADFVGSSFENWTKEDPALTLYCDMEFDHRADMATLRQLLSDFVQNDDDVIEKDEAAISVVDHSATGKIVRALVRARDPQSGWGMHCRLREHMITEAAKLDGASDREIGPIFLPRGREVQTDLVEPRKAAE